MGCSENPAFVNKGPATDVNKSLTSCGPNLSMQKITTEVLTKEVSSLSRGTEKTNGLSCDDRSYFSCAIGVTSNCRGKLAIVKGNTFIYVLLHHVCNEGMRTPYPMHRHVGKHIPKHSDVCQCSIFCVIDA